MVVLSDVALVSVCVVDPEDLLNRITSNMGKWDSNTIPPGATFSHVFRKAGTFRYHCSIHPSMKGKIVVT